MIGRKLAHFEVTAKLGEGGMGVVWRATDLKLKREVAVKVLPAEMASDPERLERFQREAQAIAALNHPNIVAIHSVDQAEGLHLLVMELVEGQDLGKLLSASGMELERFLDLAIQIADAVSAAHEEGIIHRDLKPANVMVAARDRVKVLDFGLAKLAQQAKDEDAETLMMTRTGAVMGTVLYMSPEQAQGQPVDHRSDVFSLGTLLYEMATGRQPFQAESQAAAISAVLRDQPPQVTAINADLPNQLARIVRRCLEKDPELRYQSARSVRHELEALREEVRSSSVATAALPNARTDRLKWGWPVTLAATVVVAASGWWLLVGRMPGEPAPPKTPDVGVATAEPGRAVPTTSVAVLPFADLSPEGDQEYLGDGIAEELLSALSQIEDLKVASRTSSFSFKGQNLDIQEIGERLGVAAVIEGSVRKSGDQLRIEARLVSVEDGFRSWSDRFDTPAADIFAVQDFIALSVSRELELSLSEGPTEVALKGQTADYIAQDLYLKGRFAWNRRTQKDLERAVSFFEQAVDRDSTYARALVGLGDAYAVLGFYDYRSPAEAFPLAQQAAQRALAIDATMAEPHATLGYAALYYDWDWGEAERQFLRALELRPGYPVAHQWYANYLTAMGRFEEAAQEMRTASALDPLSTIASAATGWVYLYAREYERAIRLLEAVSERDPSFEVAYLWRAQANEGLQRLAEAEALIQRAVDLSGGSAISRAAEARIVALGGQADEARRILAELEQEGDSGYVPSYEMARAFVGLGAHEVAIAWLHRAYEERAHSMAFLAVDPQLEPLHGHEGYEQLVRLLRLR